MKTISSRHNAWFKRVRAAIDEHAGEIVIEGPKQVADAIAAGWQPLAIMVSASRSPSGAPTSSAAPQIILDDSLFQSVAETTTTQGVLALFVRPNTTLDELLAREDTVTIALDGVQDPGNVGTIVRLAAAFDASGVILLPGCADPYSPKAIRASASAIIQVPVATASPDALIAVNRPLFAADASGKTTELPTAGTILILGSEGAGVRQQLRDRATRIRINMSDRVESLNVATAAAILLARSFEARRSS